MLETMRLSFIKTYVTSFVQFARNKSGIGLVRINWQLEKGKEK